MYYIIITHYAEWEWLRNGGCSYFGHTHIYIYIYYIIYIICIIYYIYYIYIYWHQDQPSSSQENAGTSKLLGSWENGLRGQSISKNLQFVLFTLIPTSWFCEHLGCKLQVWQFSWPECWPIPELSLGFWLTYMGNIWCGFHFLCVSILDFGDACLIDHW